MKFHITLLSAAIAATMLTSPVWADNDKDAVKPVTTSEPKNDNRPDNRPPEQRVREQEKDKDDAKAIPKTKPAANADLVQSDKTIHYKGDKITLKTVVPKSLKDVWEGKAIVKVVITMPGDLGAAVVDVPTPAADQETQGDKPRQLVELPPDVASSLPAGDYQMAMIVTKLGGDPLNLKDWYGGFKAMLGVKRLKINATTTPDVEDPDKTGEVVGDANGDGYPDSDPNMPPPPPPTGGTTGGATTATPTTGEGSRPCGLNPDGTPINCDSGGSGGSTGGGQDTPCGINHDGTFTPC